MIQIAQRMDSDSTQSRRPPETISGDGVQRGITAWVAARSAEIAAALSKIPSENRDAVRAAIADIVAKHCETAILQSSDSIQRAHRMFAALPGSQTLAAAVYNSAWNSGENTDPLRVERMAMTNGDTVELTRAQLRGGLMAAAARTSATLTADQLEIADQEFPNGWRETLQTAPTNWDTYLSETSQRMDTAVPNTTFKNRQDIIWDHQGDTTFAGFRLEQKGSNPLTLVGPLGEEHPIYSRQPIDGGLV
ncbi:MAG: hypothetical protein AAFP90_24580, partial [Planctomycetota bacterium]